jgi:hypothetical protein
MSLGQEPVDESDAQRPFSLPGKRHAESMIDMPEADPLSSEPTVEAVNQ